MTSHLTIRCTITKNGLKFKRDVKLKMLSTTFKNSVDDVIYDVTLCPPIFFLQAPLVIIISVIKCVGLCKS